MVEVDRLMFARPVTMARTALAAVLGVLLVAGSAGATVRLHMPRLALHHVGVTHVRVQPRGGHVRMFTPEPVDPENPGI